MLPCDGNSITHTSLEALTTTFLDRHVNSWSTAADATVNSVQDLFFSAARPAQTYFTSSYSKFVVFEYHNSCGGRLWCRQTQILTSLLTKVFWQYCQESNLNLIHKVCYMFSISTITLQYLAPPLGLEPRTSCLTGIRSDQLSYGGKFAVSVMTCAMTGRRNLHHI